MQNKRKNNEDQIALQMKTVNIELKDGVFVFTGPLTIQEFSNSVNKGANEIVGHFFKKGKMYNLNYTLNEEQIAELCLKYEFDFKKESEITASNFMNKVEITDEKDELTERPPIITIMGHVDHGKTTLLDKIRNANIVATEAGGITQHMAAYQVEHEQKSITFLDTPGHEAFTAMRTRGVALTDIVVLVVAADDGVMPQTKESIDHSKLANVPIIVFVNKMDKKGVDIERLKGDLSNHNVVAEDWGGDVQFVYGSALLGDGIDKLFNAINIQAEILELMANKNRHAIGTVVEAKLDKGMGVVATLIVSNGSLFKKDFIVAGSNYGRVKTMKDSFGNNIDVAMPGTPIVITGLNYTPKAGDKFFGFIDEKFAKNLATKKAFADKQKELKSKAAIEVSIKDGVKKLNIIIKSDVQGIAEAIKYALLNIQNDEVKINVVRAAVGAISKTDILLAQASNAMIYGFNIRPSIDIKDFANHEEIKIKTFSIIYKIIEDVELKVKGMMAPKYKEEVTGKAQILKVIFASAIGNIAGSVVISGTIYANSKVRIIRGEKIIHEGKFDSLQRGSNQAKTVNNGNEFGCHIKGFNDIKVDDIIEAYSNVEIKL